MWTLYKAGLFSPVVVTLDGTIKTVGIFSNMNDWVRLGFSVFMIYCSITALQRDALDVYITVRRPQRFERYGDDTKKEGFVITL